MNCSMFFLALLWLAPGPASSLLHAELIHAGTVLEARLLSATGTRISHPGDPVEATIVAPVHINGRTLIPMGSTLSGEIGQVVRLRFGIKNLTASIEYKLNTLTLPGGLKLPIDSRLVSVESAKERVDEAGVVQGIRPTASLGSSFMFYGMPVLFTFAPEIATPMLGAKLLIARAPDSEITYPTGTELMVQLKTAIDVPEGDGSERAPIRALSEAEFRSASQLVSRTPEQRAWKGGKPSDLVNILFLGSREQISRAFKAAGWAGEDRHSAVSLFRIYHSMVQRMGYRTAPMGRLTLDGVQANASYQKSLNTLAKRHHVRVWKAQGQDGDAWFAAATEDVAYGFQGMHITHSIDPNIDTERAKVVNDLAFTGCVDAAALLSRNKLSLGPAPKGAEPIVTDRKIVVVLLNECHAQHSPNTLNAHAGAPGKSRFAQSMTALRDDILRSNLITLGINTSKLISTRRQTTTAAAKAVPRVHTRQLDWLPAQQEQPILAQAPAEAGIPGGAQ